MSRWGLKYIEDGDGWIALARCTSVRVERNEDAGLRRCWIWGSNLVRVSPGDCCAKEQDLVQYLGRLFASCGGLSDDWE